MGRRYLNVTHRPKKNGDVLKRPIVKRHSAFLSVLMRPLAFLCVHMRSKVLFEYFNSFGEKKIREKKISTRKKLLKCLKTVEILTNQKERI